VEKTGGVAEGEGRCEEVVVGLLARTKIWLLLAANVQLYTSNKRSPKTESAT